MRRGARLAGALAAVLLAGACSSDEDRVAQHLARAERHREAGAHREELLELRAGLQLAPQSAELNQRIARAYEALGEPEEAVHFYGEAYRLDPSRTRAALARIPALSALDPDAAEALLDEVLEREPDNARAHARRAELALIQRDTARAQREALLAVELAPRDVLPLRVLGTVYRARIRNRALLGEPQDPALFEAAIDAFDRAEALRTEDATRGAWHDRREKALVYAAWPGHAEQAAAAFRAAFAMARDAGQRGGAREVARDCIRYAVRIRDEALVRWALENLLELSPGDATAWRQLAALERAAGGSSDDVWSRALALRPDDVAVHVGWARELARSGRSGDAIAHLEGLGPELAATPDVPALLVEIGLGHDPEVARAALARLEARHPAHPLARLAAASVDLEGGRIASAVERLRTLAGERERTDVFRLLARAELKAGNDREALRAAQRAEAIDGTPDPVLLRVRMEAHARLGDWPAVLAGARELRRRRFPPRFRDALLQGRALYAVGRPERAREELAAYLSPERPVRDAVLLFAAEEGATRPARTRELLEACLARCAPADDPHWAVLRAVTLLDVENDRVEPALARIDAVGETRSLPPPLRVLRAGLLSRLGRFAEAEQAASAVFESHPEAPGVARLLVRVLEAQGKRDEAIARLEAARREAGLAPAQLWLLAGLHLDAGEPARARPLLETALGEAPQLHAAKNDLAFVLAESGEELERALRLAREARAALPENPAVADTLGYVYYRLGLLDPAATELRAAIREARLRGAVPADFHYHLGLVLEGLGRHGEALRELETALALSPEHGRAQSARDALAASRESPEPAPQSR